VRVIRNDKQKDNLAKFCWDMAKISLGGLVIAPVAKPKGIVAALVIAGFVSTLAFVVLGDVIDGMEVQRC
jgi:hypothetical protein